MKTLKTVFAFALAAALVLSLNLTAFADSLPIGIPDDGTNLSRGIKLLETAGLITVDPEAGYTPEIADITGYLYCPQNEHNILELLHKYFSLNK